MGLVIGRPIGLAITGAISTEGILLSVSLNCLCRRWWQAFEGVWLPMQALRYFFPQSSLSTRLDSRALVTTLLIPWHRLCCSICYQSCTPYCCQSQILALNHLLALSLWYPVSAIIHERRREFSTSWAIWACKLTCQLDVIVEKDQKSWLLACGFA